jgi:Transcriptional regulator, AbiEi antitoxin/Protein of unknown function (DUF559)
MPHESAFARSIADRMQTRGRDSVIAELAQRQHGVVARRQLVELGLSGDAIAHRIEAGRLHRLHSGVYAVGHRAFPLEGKWMAGVLAGGEGAVLSHASAAILWGLARSAPSRAEVTSPRSSRSTPLLRRHCSFLAADEVAVRRRIPVTCVARTLFDLAAEAQPWEFERLVREAEFLKLPQAPSLGELYLRHPRRRGARLVRRTLEGLSRLPDGPTRSPLEDRFLRFAKRADLPLPETNVELRLGGVTYAADCLWREHGLIVELDGHEAHGTRSAFESDRERDRRMQAAGWRVIRITSRQLRTPKPLARDLRRLLASSHESAITRL